MPYIFQNTDLHEIYQAITGGGGGGLTKAQLLEVLDLNPSSKLFDDYLTEGITGNDAKLTDVCQYVRQNTGEIAGQQTPGDATLSVFKDPADDSSVFMHDAYTVARWASGLWDGGTKASDYLREIYNQTKDAGSSVAFLVNQLVKRNNAGNCQSVSFSASSVANLNTDINNWIAANPTKYIVSNSVIYNSGSNAYEAILIYSTF